MYVRLVYVRLVIVGLVYVRLVIVGLVYVRLVIVGLVYVRLVIVAGDLNCSREAIDSAYIQDTPVSDLSHDCHMTIPLYHVTSHYYMEVQKENG